MDGFVQILGDVKEMMKIATIEDEVGCILRVHLLTEEILNLWVDRLTGTEDLFKGSNVTFRSKLSISKNLGFNEELIRVLKTINKIRNRFSHRRGYKFEKSEIESLKNDVDEIFSHLEFMRCEEVHMQLYSETGELYEESNWEKANNRVRFIMIFTVLKTKIIAFLQTRFQSND